MLGLVLVLRGGAAERQTVRRLAKAITAFTVAHSITLGLSVLDVVRLSNATTAGRGGVTADSR